MFGVSKDSEIIYQEAVLVASPDGLDYPEDRVINTEVKKSGCSSSSSSSSSGGGAGGENGALRRRSLHNSARVLCRPLAPPLSYLKPFTPYQSYYLRVVCKSSAPLKPACGPGPSLPPCSRPMSKSYSVDDNQSQQSNAGSSRNRQRSVSGHGSKKTPARTSEDVLKRSRVQTGYELSQDLLDKQIEMLERKYGGVRARHAALTIQRAFRRYTLVKKFAAITAMAKAENRRLSRRLPPVDLDLDRDMILGIAAGDMDLDMEAGETDPEVAIRNNFADLYRELSENLEKGTSEANTVTSPVGDAAGKRAPKPSRSLSLREKRPQSPTCTPNQTLTGRHEGDECSQHSVTTSTPRYVHDNESDLSDREMPSYSAFDESSVYYAPVPTPCRGHGGRRRASPCASPSPSHLRMANGDHSCSYYARDSTLEDSGGSAKNSSPMYPGGMTRSWRDASTWNALQQHQQQRASRSQTRKVPPEVPKRTSSISARSLSTDGQWQQHDVSAEVVRRRFVQHCRRQQTESVHVKTERSNSLVAPGTQFVRSPDQQLGAKTLDNGSLSSIQSSSSDSSSVSGERPTGEDGEARCGRISPVWKRKAQPSSSKNEQQRIANRVKTKDNVSQSSEDERIYGARANYQLPLRSHSESQPAVYKVPEIVRKRQYRVGLNLFNKKPEKGVVHLIQRGFLENSPQAVARFLISRKGLSKQMIGEYLGNLQNAFNMAVLECFAQELDLSRLDVDVALRRFQTYFRMPGEAQKIERLMEVFGQRYCRCNADVVAKFHSPDTVFVLAFAVIMLNTDLHTPNLKPERRMKLDDFIKNLRGIDDGSDICREMLVGIYERVKATEFKPGSDHVTQVMKVQQTIVGKKPNLALPHRRLVCYCRLYEIPDVNKKERQGTHQREVFLFNDLLVITKIFSKKKNLVTYTFRQSFPLCGMAVSLFEVPHYQYGIRLVQRVDGKVLVTFNARNEHDRSKFVEDLRESISEMDEMENLRIEGELDKQKAARARASENRDSGVADVEVIPAKDFVKEKPQAEVSATASAVGNAVATSHAVGVATGLKRSALSNSLLDIHEQCDKTQRRGSVGSLDSGMSVSFQSTSASSISRDSSPQNVVQQGGTNTIIRAANARGAEVGVNGLRMTPTQQQQQSFLGGLFGKKDGKSKLGSTSCAPQRVVLRDTANSHANSHSTEV